MPLKDAQPFFETLVLDLLHRMGYGINRDRGIWIQDRRRNWYYGTFIGICRDVDFAHAIGVAVPVITSYLGHRRWSFRSS